MRWRVLHAQLWPCRSSEPTSPSRGPDDRTADARLSVTDDLSRYVFHPAVEPGFGIAQVLLPLLEPPGQAGRHDYATEPLRFDLLLHDGRLGKDLTLLNLFYSDLA